MTRKEMIMKYREDFVTNSSSSSFVIAMNKDCTRKIIYDLLVPLRKEIVDFFKEQSKYGLDIPNDIKTAIAGHASSKEIAKKALLFLTNNLYDGKYGDTYLNLKDWKIASFAFNDAMDDCDDVMRQFIYEFAGEIEENDYFKFAG